MSMSLKVLVASLLTIAVNTSYAATVSEMPTVMACSTSVKCNDQATCNALGGLCGCLANPIGPHCISTAPPLEEGE